MTHKYQLGDIISNVHYNYLIKDIKTSDYYGVSYILLRLEDGKTLPAYVSIVDYDTKVKKVA